MTVMLSGHPLRGGRTLTGVEVVRVVFYLALALDVDRPAANAAQLFEIVCPLVDVGRRFSGVEWRTPLFNGSGS